jgi:hypothetical protein
MLSTNDTLSSTTSYLDSCSCLIQQALSASKLLRETFESSLSCTPIHPYDVYKSQYLPNDTEPLTLESIPFPTDFCPYTCTRQITAISAEINQNAHVQVCALTACDTLNYECNAFATLSATLSGNMFVVNEHKAKNYIQFLELVRSIPIHVVERNPEDIAKKLVTQYIKMLK